MLQYVMLFLNSLPIIFMAFVLSSCSTPQHLQLTRVEYGDLPHFNTDPIEKALPALAYSCQAIMKNPSKLYNSPVGKRAMSDYIPFCRCIMQNPHMSRSQLRSVLQAHLAPYHVHYDQEDSGLFTGYYEPILRGSLKKRGRYQTPLYKKPSGSYLARLPRKDIVRGALKNKSLELVYVDDPIDAFFLQIQGSGRVQLDNGHIMHLSYATGNKQPYTPIGKTLIEQGHLVKGRDPITMQSIKAWLRAHPRQAENIMSTNKSYVFFKIGKHHGGPIGAQGVPLTAGRSLAIDPKFITLGTPLWIHAHDEKIGTFQQLMIAQDTGGAIKGAIRGDFFFGTGHAAGEKAGVFKACGSYFVLLPR